MLQVASKQTYLTNNSIFTEDLYTRWLRFVDATDATNITYRRALKQFGLFLSTNGITAPTREDIYNYKADLIKRTKPATVALYLTVVKNFFSWLEQEGLYKDVARHVKAVKVQRLHKRDALTAAQIKEIINNMDTDTVEHKRNYAIFLLLVTAGLRSIEVSRANMEDLRTVGDSTVLFIQGKGRTEKDEYAKVTAEVDKAIREYLAVTPAKAPTDALFTSTSNNSTGKRLSTRSIRSIVKAEFKKNGFNSDRLTCHSCRHSVATINLLNGGTLEETQQLLRHHQITSTMVYNHSLARINNNSESRVAGVIFSS